MYSIDPVQVVYIALAEALRRNGVNFVDVTQLGIGGVTLFLLMMVWQELRTQNAFQRQMLLQAAEERAQNRDDVMSLKMRLPPREK